jgi:hypothetical protein
MSAIDQFKAAFLSKSNLAGKMRQRVNAALEQLAQARSIVESLADNLQAPALQALDDLEQRIMDQVTLSASKPGASWAAMDDL